MSSTPNWRFKLVRWFVLSAGASILIVFAWHRFTPQTNTLDAQKLNANLTNLGKQSLTRYEVFASSESQSKKTFALLEAAFERSDPCSDPSVIKALESLAENPSECLSIGKLLLAKFPLHAVNCSTLLVGALTRTGAHRAALEIVAAGPESERDTWIAIIYTHWIAAEPKLGPSLINELRYNIVDTSIFPNVVRAWANAAPTEVAEYAIKLPKGEERQIALTAALDRWVLQDPTTVLDWMLRLSDDHEFDYALSQLVVRGDTLIRPTRDAIKWAESIQNPTVRSATLAHAVTEWFSQDSAAAVHYLDQSDFVPPAERRELAASLNNTALSE
jgi:hypothetical protein